MARDRVLTLTGILVSAFLCLLAGHFLITQYMPNAVIGGVVGLLLVAIIFYYVLNIRRDIFGFIILVYIVSHFNYGQAYGGLFNTASFFVLVVYLAANRVREGFVRRDKVMSAILFIFILSNLLGWVLKNPVPMLHRFEGIAAFFGYIFMFHLASNVAITRERASLFLSVTFVMVLYQFLVALNQRYGLVGWNTPLVGGYMELGKLVGNTEAEDLSPSGTIRHFELFGEYGALMVCLLVPFLSSSITQGELKFGVNRIVIMILVAISFPVITSDRAAAVLVVFAFILYYLIFPTGIFSSIDRFIRRQAKVLLVFAVLLPLVGAYIGLGRLEEDFGRLSDKELSAGNIVSGKSINRGWLITEGLERIEQESWWIGYGYGVQRSNEWAWFGADPEKRESGVSDFHSLYLSLPMVYGWVGSFAFLSMIVLTAFRMFRTSMRYRKRKSFLVVFAVGFTMFWLVFLIDQYKISILRNTNYQMLFWIWLGLSNAVFKTIRYEKQESGAPVSRLRLRKTDRALVHTRK